jgi:hypothetical protein
VSLLNEMAERKEIGSFELVKPLPIFRRNLDAFDLAHTGRLASLRRFGNPLMRAEH